MGSCPNEARRRHSTFAAFFLTGEPVAVMPLFRDLRSIEQRTIDDDEPKAESRKEALQLDIRAAAQEEFEVYHKPGRAHLCQGCLGVSLSKGLTIEAAVIQFLRERQIIREARFRGDI